MAANRHTGAANRKDNMVTYNELKINGQKPNSPLDGDHSEELIRLDKDCSSNKGFDFKYNAIPIIKGNNRMITREVTIHAPDKRFKIARLSIIYYFNLSK